MSARHIIGPYAELAEAHVRQPMYTAPEVQPYCVYTFAVEQRRRTKFLGHTVMRLEEKHYDTTNSGSLELEDTVLLHFSRSGRLLHVKDSRHRERNPLKAMKLTFDLVRMDEQRFRKPANAQRLGFALHKYLIMLMGLEREQPSPSATAILSVETSRLSDIAE